VFSDHSAQEISKIVGIGILHICKGFGSFLCFFLQVCVDENYISFFKDFANDETP
jgi:hypothetical protein